MPLKEQVEKDKYKVNQKIRVYVEDVIQREPGVRAKVAVYSENENIDPVGSCIGPKGLRIESIKKELHRRKNRCCRME